MKIFIAGDFAPIESPVQDISDQALSEQIFGSIHHLISDADLAICNLETPLSFTTERNIKIGPNLYSAPRYASVLKDAGFNLVSLSNNHIFDSGFTGLKDTLQACKEVGLNTVGAGLSLADAEKPFLFLKDGKLLSILNVCENEFCSADDETPGANGFDFIRCLKSLQKAKENADYILIIYHGGQEHCPVPTPEMQRRCRFFAEMGASAVICHHSHIVAGMEYWNNVPIFYSLGNFFFPVNWSVPRHWFLGLAVNLDFTNQGCRPHHYHISFSKEEFNLKPVSNSEIDAAFQNNSDILKNSEKLKSEWEKYSETYRRQIYFLLCSCVPIRILYRLYKWKILKKIVPQRAILILLNYFQCETHRENFICIIKREKNRIKQNHNIKPKQ